jgi:hypothetical protein
VMLPGRVAARPGVSVSECQMSDQTWYAAHIGRFIYAFGRTQDEALMCAFLNAQQSGIYVEPPCTQCEDPARCLCAQVFVSALQVAPATHALLLQFSLEGPGCGFRRSSDGSLRTVAEARAASAHRRGAKRARSAAGRPEYLQ